jgi:hypothetical protein
MIKISRYFENPFADPQISGDELHRFSEDHLGKLTAQNASGPRAGTLATMISATQAAFDAFDAALSTRAQQFGAQLGGTMSKDDVLKLFRTTMRQRRGRVVDKLGENSAAYREIFPSGLEYYTRATMANVGERIAYAVEKFTKYKDALGDDLVTEITAVQSSFTNARTQQVGDMGAVDQARQGVRDTRTPLELQLLDNLLTLAKSCKGQPEQAAQFFDQSLLEDPARPAGGTAPGGKPTPPAS